jgi:hypothetical protein
MVKAAEVDSAAVRRVLDPEHPDSTEFDTMVSGLIALEVFLKERE